MSRPARNDVDYFPFLCKEGIAMEYINNKYGNDGYATWIRILRELAVKNYHYLDLSDEIQSMTLTAKCRISEEKLIEIITDLVKLGEFNAELWKEKKVIYSQKFIDSIKDAYKKRSNPCIDLNTLKEILSGEKSKATTVPEVQEIKKSPRPEKQITEQSLIDFYFNDFPNSVTCENIARVLNVDKSLLIKSLPEFRKSANLSYPNGVKFAEHFKNWYLKVMKTQTASAPKKRNQI